MAARRSGKPVCAPIGCLRAALGGAINSCQGPGGRLLPRVMPSLPSRPELAALIFFSVCPVPAATAATRSLAPPSPDPPLRPPPGSCQWTEPPAFLAHTSRPREPQPRQPPGEEGSRGAPPSPAAARRRRGERGATGLGLACALGGGQEQAQARLEQLLSGESATRGAGGRAGGLSVAGWGRGADSRLLLLSPPPTLHSRIGEWTDTHTHIRGAWPRWDIWPPPGALSRWELRISQCLFWATPGCQSPQRLGLASLTPLIRTQ